MLEQISITQIKRSKNIELIKMAKERNIELSQCKTIKEMRDVIIAEAYGEKKPGEEAGENSARDYSVLKEAVLRAYVLTGEAYRQKFLQLKKWDSESYEEFIAQKGLFDRWISTEKVDNDFEKLSELIILEEVNNGLPVDIHLDDKAVNTLEDAAVSLDKYVLSHKSQPSSITSTSDNTLRS